MPGMSDPREVFEMLIQQQFSQGKFLAEYRKKTGKRSLGVCARLTYEWAAAKMGGLPFNYASVDVQNCESYMAPYTREAFSMLTESTFKGNTRFGASRYVVTDILQLKEHLNKWGEADQIQCTEGVRSTLSHYVTTRLSWHGAVNASALILTFYMNITAKELKGLPGITVGGPLDRPIIAGHVLGYSVADSTFFDSNLGYYKLAGNTITQNAQEIDTYISKTYGLYGFTANEHDRGVFKLAKTIH
jgi:hypothetical protein